MNAGAVYTVTVSAIAFVLAACPDLDYGYLPEISPKLLRTESTRRSMLNGRKWP